MSNIKLDLSNFKYKSSDKNSTTLEHEKHKHIITLAHKALSPENQKALKMMGESANKSSDKSEAKQDNEKYGNISDGKGQKAQVFKDGGEVQSKGIWDSIVDTTSKYHNDIVENPKPKDQHPDPADPKHEPKQQFAEGGEAEAPVAGSPGSPLQQMTAIDPNAAVTDPDLQFKQMYEHNLQQNIATGMSPDVAKTNALLIAKTAKDHMIADNKNMNEDAAATAVQQQQDKDRQDALASSIGMAPQPQQAPQMPQMPTAQDMPAPDQNAIQQASEANQQSMQPKAPNTNDVEGMLHAGYENKMAGIGAQAQAQGALGQAQADALEQNIKIQQDNQNIFKNQYEMLEKERQAHMVDIQNGHIDPNQYWTGDPKTGEGSHSKVASAIGMILAGFNPTSSPNAAVNFLKYQMDQNLEAQKQNLNSKQNLLSANLRQFGNLKDATDMTRLMQSDIVHNQLMQAAGKAQTPMAKAAAMQAAGDLQMQYAPLQQQFALRRSAIEVANQVNNSGEPGNTAPYEQMITYRHAMGDHEGAKDMESKLVPQVGISKIPVPQEARKEMIAKQQLNTAAADLYKYSQQHTNLLPGTAEYNHGVSKALAFQQMVREGLLGTVFRESEKPLLEKFVKENPAGALKAISTQPQLKGIIEANQMGLDGLKAGYGIPVARSQQQEAPQYKTVNGVKYMRGPNGKAIPVK